MDIAEPVRELARELDDVPVLVTGASGFVGLSLVIALAGRKRPLYLYPDALRHQQGLHATAMSQPLAFESA